MKPITILAVSLPALAWVTWWLSGLAGHAPVPSLSAAHAPALERTLERTERALVTPSTSEGRSLPAESVVAIDLAESPAAPAESAPATSGRAVSLCRGRVTGPSGQAVETADILAFRAAGEERVHELLARGRSDAGGAFELEVPTAAEAVLVLLHDEHAPETRAIGATTPGVRELGVIRLALDAVVSGVVSPVDTEAGAPALSATPIIDGGVSRHYRGAPSLVWKGGRAARPRRAADVRPDGAFTIRGLAPGPHHLMVVHGRSCQLGVAITQVQVDAPRSAVELQARGASIVVRVLDARSGERLPRARIHIRGVGFVCNGGSDGETSLGLPPDTSYDLDVACDGFRTRTLQAVSPAVGERRYEEIALDPEPSHGTLVARVDGGGQPVEQVQWTIEYGPDDVRETRSVQTRASDGEHRLEGLPLGVLRVTADANGAWNGLSSMLLPTTFDLTLEPERTAHEHLSLREGGRLAIRAVDAAGRPLAAPCDVRGDGEDVATAFLSVEQPLVVRVGELDDRGASLTHPALPTGTYTVTLEHAAGPRTLRADVREGEVTAVRFDPLDR